MVSPIFYKTFWKTTGRALIAAIHHFFKSDHMLTALNHTFIALIPKSPHPFKVERLDLLAFVM